VIAAEALGVRLGARASLEDVSLRAAPGEIVGVVGAASSGKSVLLKSLCLLVRPTTGRVLFDGVDLGSLSRDALAAQRSRIGFAFQNLALFDRLTATENVSFTLERRGLPRDEAQARARTQLQAVGLAHATEKLPHEMSGGMKRRLALARAMVARPALALYDDPFVGLDPVACARIASLIAAAHRESGGATVVAAGDPTPLFGVAHRLVLLERGRVAAALSSSDFAVSALPAVRRYLGPGVAA
jgi:ABC-type transporter Mla maintaining outer membrane lipid asymmetry ATPase subunit MlaF